MNYIRGLDLKKYLYKLIETEAHTRASSVSATDTDTDTDDTDTDDTDDTPTITDIASQAKRRTHHKVPAKRRTPNPQNQRILQNR